MIGFSFQSGTWHFHKSLSMPPTTINNNNLPPIFCHVMMPESFNSLHLHYSSQLRANFMAAFTVNNCAAAKLFQMHYMIHLYDVTSFFYLRSCLLCTVLDLKNAIIGFGFPLLSLLLWATNCFCIFFFQLLSLHG